ncbi:MAG TPA: hypothetical protein PK413_20580, partial [Thermoanaerobaculia bacterium]|nr:hypothetical protein [Thermoanaerobaculia bacterium]
MSDWLHGSSNSLETQLVRLSQVAEAARGAGDPELARAFESQAVELRQALFRAWSSEIEGASGDSIGRLEKIRSLIARAMTDPDSSHRLESLSFLADRVGWALLDRSETNVLAEALKEMEPALAPVVSTGLRFEIAASALAACDSADACRQHSQACIAVLRDLRSRAETRRSLVESALLDLTRPLSSADRRVIWSALLGGLENSYLFLAEPGSWPSGLQSFPTRARQVLVDMAGEPVLAQGQLIERLASTPIYEAEIRYLRETAELSWAHYRLIEVLHRALTSTSSTAALSTASDVRGVREGLEDEYEEYAAGPTHWDAPLNPTKLLHDGLTTLLEELSRSSGSLGDSLRSKLRGRLRAL